MAFLLFYTTYPDEATAQQIAGHLLDRRLIACANIFSIESAYWWQGAVRQEGEWVAVLKTQLELETLVEQEIQKIHPYEVPCVLRFEVRANGAYEDWIRENTSGPDTPVIPGQ